MTKPNASTPSPNGADTGLSVSDAADQIAGLFSPEPGTTKSTKSPSAKPPVSESEPDAAEDETEVDTEAEGTDEVDPEAEDDAEDETDAASSDDDDEAEDHGDETDLEAEYAFEHDGKTIKVTARELIRGFRREDDYTRKTQAMAEKVKTAEAETEETRKERAVYAHLVGELRKHLQKMQPKEPDWAKLKADDPVEYAIQSVEWSRRQDQIKAAQAEETRLAELEAKEKAEKQQGQLSEALKQQRVKLYELLPHWKDPAKATAEGAQVRAYALKAGLSKEEVDSIAQTSALAISILRKAMLYDRAVERSKGLRPSPQPAPRNTATPGASNRVIRNASELRKATQRLAKTGALKDASRAIELLI